VIIFMIADVAHPFRKVPTVEMWARCDLFPAKVGFIVAISAFSFRELRLFFVWAIYVDFNFSLFYFFYLVL
jgi:hypothetical protein